MANQTSNIAAIINKAAEARTYFTTATRDNGAEFIKTVDGAPDWVQPLCHAAHGDMLPDDWRYQAIVEVLDAISEADESADPSEIRDTIEADIYTSDLTGWLHSRTDRYGYCDEAVEEYGADAVSGTIQLLQMGQSREYDEVFWAVWNWLSENTEESEA